MFLEVKNLKNVDPILGFQPNFFFKIHQSLVISLPQPVVKLTISKLSTCYQTHRPPVQCVHTLEIVG